MDLLLYPAMEVDMMTDMSQIRVALPHDGHYNNGELLKWGIKECRKLIELLQGVNLILLGMKIKVV